MNRLFNACNTAIENDAELQGRLALVDKLYALAGSEEHWAVKFAESISERVYEYELRTVFVPNSSQSEALQFLMADRDVKQKDLAAIVSRREISEILTNKKRMTAAQINGFAEFFKVPVEFFMHEVV